MCLMHDRILLVILFQWSAILCGQIIGGGMIQQPPRIGKISGQVVDSLTKKPVAYATVLIQEALEKIDVDGAITEENGSFKIKELKNAKYNVIIALLGYERKTLGPFKINKDQYEYDLGKIFLAPISKQLGEVVVREAKELVENKLDRLVFYADRDVTTKGGNAADVLRRTPLLTVDLEGNVSLRGSSQIQLLINGKPSTILAGNARDALKMIPADVIEKVEVITNPGAKYDAEGTGGIINIVTKTKKISGTSGSLFVSAGTRSSNLGTNLSTRIGNLGFNANIGGYMWNARGESQIVRTNKLTNVLPYFNQQVTSANAGGGLFASLAADVDINPKNSITVSAKVPLNLFSSDNTMVTRGGELQDTLPFMFKRVNDILNRTTGIDVNADYRRTFRKDSDQEFNLSAQYSINNRLNRYTSDQYDLMEMLNYQEVSPNKGVNAEYIFASDYLHPLAKKMNFECGAKAILRNVKSDIFYDTLDIMHRFYRRDFSRNNFFEYQQDVYAAYSQLTFPVMKSITGRLGLRFEQTDIVGQTQNEASFRIEYPAWIPSALVSYNLSNKQNFKVSYSRRIQRPSMFYLNPYVNFNDPTNISYGNPELNPELTESFELSYSASRDFKNINVMVYHKITNDLIDNFRFVDTLGRTHSTYNNLATGFSSGVSINGGIVRLGKIILNSTINVFYQKIMSKQFVGVKNDAVNFNVSLFGNVNLNPMWGITVFGFYNSPRLTTQGKQANWFVYNLGVRRDMWKKKGGISFGIDNFLNPRMNMKSEFSSSAFSFINNNYLESWGVRLSADYRFGKMEFGQQFKKKRRSPLADDLKQSEGENAPGQPMPR